MKIVAVVQARLGSTRLPNKVLRDINGKPLIKYLIERLQISKKLTEILVAIPNTEENRPLKNYLETIDVACVMGDEHDVLSRYKLAADFSHADIIVRITGDCPLVDFSILDHMIEKFQVDQLDYLCNNYPPTYPDGLDIEIFSLQALNAANMEATSRYDREHVTPYFRSNSKFKTETLKNDVDLSALRWTVDEIEDFRLIEKIYKFFDYKTDFFWKDILAIQEKDGNFFSFNQHLIRNEGATMGTGQKLWRRAKKVIPGGNMLLSKRSEMFLPDIWPSYFKSAQGCIVEDLDGEKFIDMSIMGIGTNTLGYGHPEVDKAVRAVIDRGNMSTFNCPEEVYLAEKLVEINPWAQMVRFARTGGEANAIAVRIARAASGRDKVAICGYHGWHDWYLSANLADEEGLDGHLLPGLEPKGVPRNLKGSVIPFKYNDIVMLQKIIENNDIGVIKMEVERNGPPLDNFLQQVRELATKNNIVLIFDECTSGFRETYGGLHKKYGVEPDLAVYGKAIGNGYAITAVVGKREIMECAQSTFISSTFWTERIGPAAALATLKVMEDVRSWVTITDNGRYIKNSWQKLASKHNIEVDVWGLDSLAGFTIKGENSLEYKTYITQEMLKKGILASNTVYSCTAHSKKMIDDYLNLLDDLFYQIGNFQKTGFRKFLDGNVCHAGFKRLN